MCRHPNVKQSKDRILIDSILKEEVILECPICFDTFDSDNLFFTECKHYACLECSCSIFKKNADDHPLVRSSIASAEQRALLIDQLIEINNITIIYNNNMVIYNMQDHDELSDY
jgi:hypothetical protein